MTSICAILDRAATEIPDQPLFVFPETRWQPEQVLTYGQLAVRAGGAAGVLKEMCPPGGTALLLFPTGPAFWEAFFGCLGAGIVAVPLKTPNFNRTSAALERVCADCLPELLVTDQETAALLERRRDQHPYLDQVRVVTPADWCNDRTPMPVLPAGDSVALLQYTSGSTAHPKGVQVTHGNLVANAGMICQQMELDNRPPRGATWLPHYHDMGLIGTCIDTLYMNWTSWCLPPEEFALHPERWLQVISQQQVSVTGGPDFAYRHCAERISDDALEGIDLSSWQVAFVGAERVRPSTLRQFVERFAKYGFRSASLFPCYGLAEATLLATGGPADAEAIVRRVSAAALFKHRIEPASSEADAVELAASGETFDGVRVIIADPETDLLLGDDEIGEVCLSGNSVTRGYLNRDEENAARFCERPIDGRPMRFFKTGDLGFLSGSQLFITGRLREMMIVRGRNLYPEDVEECVCRAHPSLISGGAVAFSIDAAGEESLIVAAELDRAAARTQDTTDVLAAIRRSVAAEFGVSLHEILLMRPLALPRTSSGKPRRLEVRDSYLQQSVDALFRQ